MANDIDDRFSRIERKIDALTERVSELENITRSVSDGFGDIGRALRVLLVNTLMNELGDPKGSAPKSERVIEMERALYLACESIGTAPAKIKEPRVEGGYSGICDVSFIDENGNKLFFKVNTKYGQVRKL